MNMPIFSGDAADIDPLQIICRTLLQHGAWFHRDLQVHAEQGELSLHSRHPDSVRTSYMRVPLKLMPILDDFIIASDGKQLRYTPLHNEVLPVHRTLMGAMIELYNLTDKLTHWESSYPGFWLDQEEPLQHLFEARKNSVCQGVYHNLRHGIAREQTLVDSFIGSRKFMMRAEHFQLSGIPRQQNGMVLLPLIDSLNHRSGADGFKSFNHASPPCIRIYARPHGVRNELFVSYNHYDPVDTFLIYGFVDESADFFFSIPCIINAGPLKIRVGNPREDANPSYFTAQLKSLGRYATSIANPEDQEMWVAGIPIPPADDLDKLRVLAGIIGEASGLVSSERDMNIFRQGFIESLLEYNLGWWQTMERKTRHLDIVHPLRTLALKGLEHLNNVAAGATSK